jgi:hypothetical protein
MPYGIQGNMVPPLVAGLEGFIHRARVCVVLPRENDMRFDGRTLRENTDWCSICRYMGTFEACSEYICDCDREHQKVFMIVNYWGQIVLG